MAPRAALLLTSQSTARQGSLSAMKPIGRVQKAVQRAFRAGEFLHDARIARLESPDAHRK
jgi:hypothetical protein